MEMKEYKTPEMEVVKIEYQAPLLEASGSTPTGQDDPQPGGGMFN